jgi:hypothetical protein
LSCSNQGQAIVTIGGGDFRDLHVRRRLGLKLVGGDDLGLAGADKAFAEPGHDHGQKLAAGLPPADLAGAAFEEEALDSGCSSATSTPPKCAARALMMIQG